jgi:hypothetical protein
LSVRTLDPFSGALSAVATYAADGELAKQQADAALAAVVSVVNDWNTANPGQLIAVPNSMNDIYFEIYNAIITAESLIDDTGVTVGDLSGVVQLLAALDGGS